MTEFERLRDIVAKLRSLEGCPWDREQTNASLVPALLEEAYEVAGAVYAQDDANLREELGDLLLLIVMHAQIASEERRFDVDEIARDVSEKLIRRHPHVFGKSEARGSEAVVLVNLARKCHLGAESLLQAATDKFVARFNEMEDRLRARGGKLGEATLEELDAIWEEIKKDSRS